MKGWYIWIPCSRSHGVLTLICRYRMHLFPRIKNTFSIKALYIILLLFRCSLIKILHSTNQNIKGRAIIFVRPDVRKHLILIPKNTRRAYKIENKKEGLT